MFASFSHGWRSWKSAKGVALLAAAALAIGIGSATAIYTVVDAVLLQPPAWEHGERFVTIFSSRTDAPERYNWSSTSWLDLLDYQRRTRSFDLFGVYLTRDFSLTAPGQPRRIRGVELTPEMAAGLGVKPVVGRWFGSASAESGNSNLAVISSALWARLGGDPRIVGSVLMMDGRAYTVTGVMPARFRFPLASIEGGEFRTEVWTPLNPQGDQLNRSYGAFFCYARLRPGVTRAQADADVKRVAAEIAREHPGEHPKTYTALALSVLDAVVRDIRPSLLLLFIAAGALLLITCANVAGIMLARTVARARETAVRVALGAGQRQLAMQYFAEGLIVGLAGAAGGVIVGYVMVRFVLSIAIDFVPRADSVTVDWRSILFAFAAAVLSSVLVSIAPLWQAHRTMPSEALGEGVRASAPARSRKLSRFLVVAEIAVAFALLAVGGVLFAHFSRLLHTPAGFVPEAVLTFSLRTNDAEYPDEKKLAPYQKRLLDGIQAIPGVSGAAIVDHLPLAGCCMVTGLFPEGSPDPSRLKGVSFRVVSPTYFQTMRIPVLQGRVFSEGSNVEGDTLGIVIDALAARVYWPGREALGAYARAGSDNGSRMRVIGIVGQVRNRGLGEASEPEMYFPSSVLKMNPTRFVVRSPVPPDTLIPRVRRAIWNVNPAQPIDEIQPMTGIVLESLTAERLQWLLTGFFASAALLMAALGVYGVVSYSVRRRTVEIGTRMALGAGSRDVLGLVLGDGLRMAAYGIAIGGIAAAVAAFLIKAAIFGIRIDDARPFVYSAATVTALVGLACFFPGWRAALVSPMAAIREDAGSILRTAASGARLLARQVSGLISGSEDAEAISGAMLMEFVDSSRRAGSFRETMQASVESVREAMRSESVLLLEKGAGAYRGIAGAPEGRADGFTIPAAGLLAGRFLRYSRPLPLSKGDFESWARWASAERPDRLAEVDTLRNAGIALAVPLISKRDLAGMLLLGAPLGRAAYTGGEKRALGISAGQFALMIENARLTERIVEQERLNRDLQLAAEVQKRLLPDKPPPASVVTLAGMSLPARSVGGDYYDFLDLGGQRIGIAIADVAGKGIAAALIMSVVQASLRILVSEDNMALGTLAAKMNRFLHRSTGSNAYATFFYAQIDQRKRQLRYVNAGHNPPCLVRCSADRQIEELPAGGTVIGLFPQMMYEENAVDLKAGDVLVAFTDGVPDALNPKDEEFGDERLKNMLLQWADLPVNEMASRIAGELRSWIDTAAQYDDLTFVLMKVNPD